MRLFFALWPDDALRRELAALAARLQARCGGRAMRGDTLHLTLAFLGEVPERQVPRLIHLCKRLPCPPGHWTLDRIGHFPRGGIVWLGSQRPEPALETLQASLWQALAEHGFAAPARAFRPHVTLLRKARSPCFEPLGGKGYDWQYDGMALVHSAADGPGRRYEILASTEEQGN